MAISVTAQRRREQGLCEYCGEKPPRTGKFKCAACAKMQAGKANERHEKLQRERICTRCGRKPMMDGSEWLCTECAEKEKTRSLARVRRNRDLAYQAYGGYVCCCCGETRKEFLSLDHINGGGTQERQQVKGSNFFARLRRQGFPPGYQVLCMNCNMGKYKAGICPHVAERIARIKVVPQGEWGFYFAPPVPRKRSMPQALVLPSGSPPATC